jgi:tellurite resistance protein
VVGLALLQLGAPALWGWALWGIAVFSLLWSVSLVPRIAALPFGLPHWALSFPLAALAALSLRLSEHSAPMRALALGLLALASLVVAALVWATLRGLRDGGLLAPEPQPVAAGATIAAGSTQPRRITWGSQPDGAPARWPLP